MSVIVRPLRDEDQSRWRELWRAYLAFYETELSEEIYASTFARPTGDDPHDHKGLIAEVDGDPVGLAHFLLHRHGWKVENVCYLQDLYAEPRVRGQGVGRALIEAVYEAADEAEAPAVYWNTQDFNAEARRLYDRIGAKTPFIQYVRRL